MFIPGTTQRNVSCAAFLLAGYLCLLPPPAHAQRVVGPGGGGAMFHATVSPHDTQEVLVACDMSGSYITHDGGQSWRMFNLRGSVRFFAFDPVDRHVLYAGNQRLWRSADDGATWNMIWPRPQTIRGVSMADDHADEIDLTDANPRDPNSPGPNSPGQSSPGQIVAFAIDPVNSHRLTAGATSEGKSAVFTSDNDGRSWKKERDLAEPPQKLWIDPHSNQDDRDLYLSERRGVVVRHGGTWSDHPAPAGVSFSDVSMGFAPPGSAGASSPTIYATSERGLFVSSDRAAHWAPSPLPGSGAHVRAVATSLHHPESAYVSYRKLQWRGKQWLGVARTRDSGTSWTLAWKEDNAAADNVHDAWITPAMGTDWGENPLELGVADQDPELCYGTDLGRTMITTDGGESWHAAYSKQLLDAGRKPQIDASRKPQPNVRAKPLPGAGWVSTGLDVTTNYGYLYDPFNHDRRFIATTDIGLFRSEDKGRTWMRSVEGVPEAWSNTTYWVEFDPRVRGKMWGGMSGTHDLPRPKMWRKTATATYRGGVCISLDGGQTWKPSNAGMPETAPTHILLDPASPVGKRTLWVAAMGRGVYKSIDDGATWTLKNNGILQQDPLAWRLSRSSTGTLYLVVARRSEDGSIGAPGDGALYQSTDGADSWQRMSLPPDTNGPNGLTVDPEDPTRLYLAAWARAVGTRGAGGGVYLSEDSGKSWKPTLTHDQHIYDVVVDPRTPTILYAAGFESSAWRSDDRGRHWSRIAAYNFKWGHRALPDLDDPSMVYVTTFGGGVWHIAATTGKGHQDIATPKMQP